MPITINGVGDNRLGFMQTSLDAATTNFDGTNVAPSNRDGLTTMTLGTLVVDFDGQAGTSQSFDGVMDADLQGLNVLITEQPTDVSNVPGNVANFGATGDGVTDDTVAVQAAMDSDHAVFFEPGEYVLTAPITITKPKSITCFSHYVRAGLFDSGLGDGRTIEKRLGENVRFMIRHSGDGFVFDSSEVHWYGGYMDTQNTPFNTSVTPTFDGDIFKVKAQDVHYGNTINETMGGFGSFITDDMAYGGNLINLDFSTAGTDAKLQGVHVFNVDPRGVKRGWSSTVTTGNQVSRGHWVDKLQPDYTRHSLYDESSVHTWFDFQHQGRGVFPQQADGGPDPFTIPATVINSPDNYFWHAQWGDFDRYTNGNRKSMLFGERVVFAEYMIETFFSSLALPDQATATEEYFGDMYDYNSRNFDLQKTGISPKEVGTTEMEDPNSYINTNGKEAGAMVLRSTDRRPYFATGPNATDSWVRIDGTSPIGPP